MTPPLLDRPAGRYGDRAPGQRRVTYAVAATLAALAVAWVAWVSLAGGKDPVSAQVLGYQQVENRVVRARLEITAPVESAAHCTLRALDQDRAVIGRGEVTAPAGRATRGVSVDIRVLTSASSVEVVDCSRG